MSLILEALKKSEAQRRLGEAPGLGTPITATRRRRSLLPWLILLVIAAVAAGGWWLFYRAPAPAPQTASAGANPAAKPTQARPRPSPGNLTAMTPPETDRHDRAGRRPPDAPGSAHPAGPQTMTTAAPPANAPPPPVTHPPAPPPDLAPPAAAAAVATTPVTAPPIAAAVLPPRPDPAAAATPMPAPTVVAPTVTPVSQPAAPAPVYAEVQNIEDLPYNVRKDIPDLPISMQVYSPDPARRFVIVNGNRKVEGDTIKDGVALHEIRPNGVVLEFHGQRFFMSRPGS
jgi:general secretion pathway protein B